MCVSQYRVAGQQQLVYSLEYLSFCAEAGRISVAISSQVCLVHMSESSHQLLEVTCRHMQHIWKEDARTLCLIFQEFTLEVNGG